MEAGPKPPLSILDGWLSRMHRGVILGHPILSLVAAWGLYAVAVLGLGARLGVTSNYFIILPVVVAAAAFQLPGGIIAGALGLPSNLLLFAVLGLPGSSPASKLAAESAGLVLGGSLGFLADYFSKFEAELKLRIATEESLRRAIGEKEAILQELHHRVRNNLNVITSIIQLQRRRSNDPGILAAADDLLGRVFAIALVHERLHAIDGGEEVSARDYLEGLASNVIQALASAGGKPRICLEVPESGLGLGADAAGVLGMIANEAITNSVRHAFSPASRDPAILVSFAREGEDLVLRVEDNGSGLAPDRADGLGLKIIRVLARQLDGFVGLGPRHLPRPCLGDPELADTAPGGTAFELTFPATAQRSSFVTLEERRLAVTGADSSPQPARSRWTSRKGKEGA